MLFVGAGNSSPHYTVQRRDRKKTFLCTAEESLREDYTSPADDIIKSACTEKKGRVGVRKMGFKQGMERQCLNERGYSLMPV